MVKYFLSAIALCALVVAACGVALADESATPATAAQPAPTDSTVAAAPDSTRATQYLVYYFYTTKRCPTCRKLEAYSRQALDSGFVDSMKTGAVVWQALNTDEKEYEHFLKDYELYTKSLVVVKMEHGKQVKWKNLEKIWELVGDEEAFIKYVQSELTAFMSES